jgi:hypothetical protein
MLMGYYISVYDGDQGLLSYFFTEVENADLGLSFDGWPLGEIGRRTPASVFDRDLIM